MSKNGSGPVVNGRGETCLIYCRLPNGVLMQLTRESTITEQSPAGAREVKVHQRFGDKYIVRGVALREGEIPLFMIAHGAAVTSGIPKGFAEEWFRQNADNEIVKRGLVWMS